MFVTVNRISPTVNQMNCDGKPNVCDGKSKVCDGKRRFVNVTLNRMIVMVNRMIATVNRMKPHLYNRQCGGKSKIRLLSKPTWLVECDSNTSFNFPCPYVSRL